MSFVQQAIVNALWIATGLTNIAVLVMFYRKTAARKLLLPKLMAFSSLCLAVIASHTEFSFNALMANIFSFMLGIGLMTFYLNLLRYRQGKLTE